MHTQDLQLQIRSGSGRRTVKKAGEKKDVFLEQWRADPRWMIGTFDKTQHSAGSWLITWPGQLDGTAREQPDRMGCKVCAEMQCHISYQRRGDAIAKGTCTQFRVDALVHHDNAKYHKAALTLYRRKHGISAAATNTSTTDELLAAHFRTCISNAMQENAPTHVPWLIELQNSNGAVVSSSHSSYSAIYDILFCAEEELVEGQDKRVRRGKVYSQIADGSTTQGARRREMESVHVKYPTLIDGADYEMDLHEGLRGVRCTTEFFGLLQVDVDHSKDGRSFDAPAIFATYAQRWVKRGLATVIEEEESAATERRHDSANAELGIGPLALVRDPVRPGAYVDSSFVWCRWDETNNAWDQTTYSSDMIRNWIRFANDDPEQYGYLMTQQFCLKLSEPIYSNGEIDQAQCFSLQYGSSTCWYTHLRQLREIQQMYNFDDVDSNDSNDADSNDDHEDNKRMRKKQRIYNFGAGEPFNEGCVMAFKQQARKGHPLLTLSEAQSLGRVVTEKWRAPLTRTTSSPPSTAATFAPGDELFADGFYPSHLIANSFDGASVNLGKNTGLASMFAAVNEQVITVHAVAHILELSLHDGLDHHEEVVTALELNQDLYSEYSRSAKKLLSKDDMAESLGEKPGALAGNHGVRWAESTARGIKEVCKQWKVVTSDLFTRASEDVGMGLTHETHWSVFLGQKFMVRFENGRRYAGKVRDFNEQDDKFEVYFSYDRSTVKFSQGELLALAALDVQQYDAGTTQPRAGSARNLLLDTRAGKLYKRATSLVTMGVNHFLADLHISAKQISKIFQSNNLSLWTVRERIEDGIASIDRLKTPATYGEYTRMFFANLDTESCCYRGKEVWFSEQESIDEVLERLKALFVEFADDTTNDMRRRFDSLLNNPVLTALLVFDHSRWPSLEQQDLLETFGDESIDFLLQHYETLLADLEVDPKTAKQQWTMLKRAIARDPVKAGMKDRELWNRLYDHFSQRSDPGHYYHILMVHLIGNMIALDTSCCERTFSLMNRLTKFQRSKLGIEMLSTLVTLCELGRRAGWDDISKIPVEAIIKRWKAKGCEKGQSRRLKKLFADGRVVDAEMEQAAGVTVTVTNVQAA
jgi:hypothetical protein